MNNFYCIISWGRRGGVGKKAGVTMTLCTHGRVSGPSSLLDQEVMAPRGYSVPCQF